MTVRKFSDFGEIWRNYGYSAKQRDVASPSNRNFAKFHQNHKNDGAWAVPIV